MGDISLGLEQAFGCRTAGRQDDMFLDAHRVTGKLQRFIFRDGNPSLLWYSLRDRGLSI